MLNRREEKSGKKKIRDMKKKAKVQISGKDRRKIREKEREIQKIVK